jgi:very-short-patch-repair endonuclease
MDDLELTREPFTRYVANRLYTDLVFRSLLREGRVRRVLNGVFVDASIEDSIELRCQAAALVISPHAVLCDRTAAWLLGVDVLLFRELEVLPPLEVFVLRGCHRVERVETRGGERDLSHSDITELFGIKVTTPLRTALDLACKLPRYPAIAALDAFMRQYGLTTEQLWRELQRYRRRRGVVQARELALKASPMAESPRESWLRLAILDSNLPAPVPQYWVKEHGVDVYRLDHAYPKSKIAVEYDGELYHDYSDEQRAADQRRRDWLRRRGWTVIVVTKSGFTDEGRQIWLNELRVALRLAA